MTASLAHELNQPLAAIVNNATAAMQYLNRAGSIREQLQDILNDVVATGVALVTSCTMCGARLRRAAPFAVE
jgi:C4-dicarboxylate-specific signal transduction histidine kinase